MERTHKVTVYHTTSDRRNSPHTYEGDHEYVCAIRESAIKEGTAVSGIEEIKSPYEPEVYVLAVIDHMVGAVLHMELFDRRPTVSPEEVGYDPRRYDIFVSGANINGGDCTNRHTWNGKEWDV